MPIYKTSYNTTVGQIVDTRKLDQALKELLTRDYLRSRDLGVPPNQGIRMCFLTGLDSDEAAAPSFVHPQLCAYKNEKYLVADLRSFRNTNAPTQSVREFETSVRNVTEYALTKSRAALNVLWLGDGIDKIRARFSFAGNVYAAWLSQAISRAYALDFNDQITIMAVSLYFYHLMFQEEKRLTGRPLEVAVVHTIKATKMPAQEVYALFERLGEMASITDYCEQLKTVIESVRLKDFNLAMLLTLIKNSWYGANAKDLLSVALEHPPTWIAIVFATMTERSFKSSGLNKLIETQAKRGNSDEFRMNYVEMIRDVILITESVSPELPPLVIQDFE